MLNSNQSKAVFRKSSFSPTGHCVEVASKDASVLVRDSKLRAEGILSFPPPAWQVFLRGIRRGSLYGRRFSLVDRSVWRVSVYAVLARPSRSCPEPDLDLRTA